MEKKEFQSADGRSFAQVSQPYASGPVSIQTGSGTLHIYDLQDLGVVKAAVDYAHDNAQLPGQQFIPQSSMEEQGGHEEPVLEWNPYAARFDIMVNQGILNRRLFGILSENGVITVGDLHQQGWTHDRLTAIKGMGAASKNFKELIGLLNSMGVGLPQGEE